MQGSNCQALKVARKKCYNENMYPVLPFSLDTVAKAGSPMVIKRLAGVGVKDHTAPDGAFLLELL